METLRLAAALLASGSLAAVAAAQETGVHTLRSPDDRIELRVRPGNRLRYDVSLRGRRLIEGASLALTLAGQTLGAALRIEGSATSSVDRELHPQVRQKAAAIRERYRELRLELGGGNAVVFRAYDEGVAYRFETALPGDAVEVASEEAVFRFAGEWSAWYPREEGFFSHNERHYPYLPLSGIGPDALASLPAVVDAGEGVKIAVVESDVEDYPGLWLRGTGGPALQAAFPPYPLREALERDRDLKMVEAADHIAVTRGTRRFPWRALVVTERDGDLLTNPLVWLLQSPSRVADASWVRPGKVAWDWWNALNVHGVDFRSGVNDATYRHFIDFAARHGLDYVILDEGWYVLGNALDVVPEIHVPALVEYGRERGVGIILWVVWKTLEDRLEEALDVYAGWGVAGLKIDFMQRDDQLVMRFYDRVAREAAERRLLLDFHGGQRPALMTRTWPHLMSAEGVMGLEHVKWSADVDPEHDVTIPFTRMLLGPMDYTPGAMVNAARGNFAPIFERPMSQGTRCHQLALYVVYESPLQMLADSPSRYASEPEAMEWLSAVPTVWDETRVLEAQLGDYVVVARRSGAEWFLGALTDWTPREMEVALDFLPEGGFAMDVWEDGINADRYGSDFRKRHRAVARGERVPLRLAPGGGWAARIRPQ